MVVPKEITFLCKLGREYYKKGWLPATAGNFSFRENEEFLWITASGLDKGNLTPKDFLKISICDGNPVFPSPLVQKPSAETGIHRAIYRQIPEANAVLHVHNPDSLKIRPGLTRENPFALWTVPPTELVKAFGFWEENPVAYLPVVYNYSEIEKIAHTLESAFQTQDRKRWIPAVLVENHGPSVWGKDILSAQRNLEALEYIMRVSHYYGTRYI